MLFSYQDKMTDCATLIVIATMLYNKTYSYIFWYFLSNSLLLFRIAE